MNIRFVLKQLGLLLIVLSIAVIAASIESIVTGSWRQESEGQALFALAATMGSGLMIGSLLWLIGRNSGKQFLPRREALLLVALSWLVCAGLAAMPFWLWALTDPMHPFFQFHKCYFEAMSGLTTTGATVLGGNHPVVELPRALLMWRSLTQWLGGLGIIVLFVAVLPSIGVGGKRLFNVEAPGPTHPGVRPRITETARLLWMIYVGLTVMEVLLLRVAGMNWFDSFCHALTTLATGGFSTQNASIGGYDSRLVSTITIVFMVLASTNFGLFYAAIRGHLRVIWQDSEFRCYLFLLAIGSTVIVCLLLGSGSNITTTAGAMRPATVSNTLTHGVFTAVSIQTNTGFTTADYNTWPFAAKAVIVMMMFIGGCAGSTGGGIKVIRIWLALRIMLSELERIFRPSVVRTVKVGKMIIEPEMRQATLVYVLGIVSLFLIGTMVLMLLEQNNPVLGEQGMTMDFTTAATASAATLNNVGPGLGLVGPTQNYGWFSAPSLMVMSLLMVLGRLEVYAILVLFVPSFWRGD